MNSLTKQASLLAVLTSSAVAGAALLITTPAEAQVVFDDGKMHVIDDDTYALERIEVRNGSKLKIVAGAVIAASIAPDYDFASGLPVLAYSAASIQVFDHSMVLVQGGTFGGGLFGTSPAFLDNWHSGSIAAFDQATLAIHGGTFGTAAFRSGTLAMFDEARLKISGGTYTNPGGSGGRIELYDQSEGKISGGVHGASINPAGNSTLLISGGTYGKDDGFFRGRIDVTESAGVMISGGFFGGTGAMSANLSVLSSSAYVKINGGEFMGTNINVEAGLLQIEGLGFNYPFGQLDAEREELFGPGSGLWIGTTLLQGVLANGDAIDVTIGAADADDAVIELVAD